MLAAEDVIEDVLPSELGCVEEAPLDCCSDTGDVDIALLLKPGEGLDNVIELSEADALDCPDGLDSDVAVGELPIELLKLDASDVG